MSDSRIKSQLKSIQISIINQSTSVKKEIKINQSTKIKTIRNEPTCESSMSAMYIYSSLLHLIPLWIEKNTDAHQKYGVSWQTPVFMHSERGQIKAGRGKGCHWSV